MIEDGCREREKDMDHRKWAIIKHYGGPCAALIC